MLLIQFKRPHDVHWYGLYTRRVVIMDESEGWYKPLFFKDQDRAIQVINAAIDAAMLLGHTVHHIVIRED
jgi:hypothetical protein